MLQQFSMLVILNRSIDIIPENDLYLNFGFAYLRSHYTLLVDAELRSASLVMLKTQETDACPGWEAFPPFFFLPVEGNPAWLGGQKHLRDMVFYNEAHPLSQFLIRNRAKLEESVLGLFWEVMESLMEYRGEQLLSKVNECLRRIDALPGGRLKVPEEAFLKESDLISCY